MVGFMIRLLLLQLPLITPPVSVPDWSSASLLRLAVSLVSVPCLVDCLDSFGLFDKYLILVQTQRLHCPLQLIVQAINESFAHVALVHPSLKVTEMLCQGLQFCGVLRH